MSTPNIAYAFTELYEKLSRVQPFLQRIWVVDRPDLVYLARQLVREATAQLSAPADSLFSQQLLVLEWHSWCATEDDIARSPWFCSPAIPGIWFEMSNGHHGYYEIPNKRVLFFAPPDQSKAQHHDVR